MSSTCVLTVLYISKCMGLIFCCTVSTIRTSFCPFTLRYGTVCPSTISKFMVFINMNSVLTYGAKLCYVMLIDVVVIVFCIFKSMFFGSRRYYISTNTHLLNNVMVICCCRTSLPRSVMCFENIFCISASFCTDNIVCGIIFRTSIGSCMP